MASLEEAENAVPLEKTTTNPFFKRRIFPCAIAIVLATILILALPLSTRSKNRAVPLELTAFLVPRPVPRKLVLLDFRPPPAASARSVISTSTSGRKLSSSTDFNALKAVQSAITETITGWDTASGYVCSGSSTTWTGVTCSTNGVVTKLDLSIMGLHGSIATAIGGLTGLTYLVLDINNLSGTIPSELALLTGLTYIDLDSNTLSGTIPSELGGLTGLYLSYNNLVGPVPASLCLPIKTAIIQIQYNTGLTCYPSCLTNPPYTRLNKDTTLTTVCGTGK